MKHVAVKQAAKAVGLTLGKSSRPFCRNNWMLAAIVEAVWFEDEAGSSNTSTARRLVAPLRRRGGVLRSNLPFFTVFRLQHALVLRHHDAVFFV